MKNETIAYLFGVFYVQPTEPNEKSARPSASCTDSPSVARAGAGERTSKDVLASGHIPCP